MALECGFLSRKGNRRETDFYWYCILIGLCQEKLWETFMMQKFGIPNAGRRDAFIPLPKEKKRRVPPISEQLRVRWTLFREKMLKLRIFQQSDCSGGGQQVCVDKAALIDPTLITWLRCWLRRTFTPTDGTVLFFSSVGFPSLHLTGPLTNVQFGVLRLKMETFKNL